MTATSGRTAASRARMSCSASRSAWQTGEPSGLRRAPMSDACTPMMSLPASATICAERDGKLVARFHFHENSNRAPLRFIRSIG